MRLIKKIIKYILSLIFTYDYYEKKIFLEGINSSKIQKQTKIINDLSDVEFSVFSQWGDDGIINWLVENLNIKKKIFIEIGTENYKESNTRFLLMKRNWTGYLIEGDKNHALDIKKQKIYWKYDLNIISKYVDRENINHIFNKLKLPKDIGLLSLDIDGIDYWVWEKIETIKPIIFICEYNAVFGDLNSLTIPYIKNFNRYKYHHSNLAFGASIKAFQKLATKKGYILLGTNSNGVNAYFIRKEYYNELKKKIRNIKKFSSKFRESRDKNYKKNFLRGIERKKKIEDVELINLDKKKEIIKLKNIKKIYSSNWNYNS